MIAKVDISEHEDEVIGKYAGMLNIRAKLSCCL